MRGNVLTINKQEIHVGEFLVFRFSRSFGDGQESVRIALCAPEIVKRLHHNQIFPQSCEKIQKEGPPDEEPSFVLK